MNEGEQISSQNTKVCVHGLANVFLFWQLSVSAYLKFTGAVNWIFTLYYISEPRRVKNFIRKYH